MSSGLRSLRYTHYQRHREEFITLTDPFIDEAFKEIMTQGEYEELEGWSRSFYTVEAHSNSLFAYNKTLLDEPTDPVWIEVKDFAFREFSTFGRVRALSAETDLKHVRYQQATAAGYGYKHGLPPNETTKGPPGIGNHLRALRIASKIVHEIANHRENNTLSAFMDTIAIDSTPDIAFTRTQLAELPNTKVRNVFGEAFHYVLLEGLVAQPLINHFMNIESFYYIGQDPVQGVPELFSSLPSEAYKVTTDWSNFDATVQVWEIELAFNLIESIIDWPSETKDRINQDVFHYVKKLFITRKIIGPDNIEYLRIGGVPSGSYFTHVIDSIINWIRLIYLLKKTGNSANFIRTHGDDSLLVPDDFPDISRMSAEALVFGWVLKPEKVKVKVDVSQLEFLGRTGLYGMNQRDIKRARRLMLFPEYPVIDPQISIARIKAIIHDTGCSDVIATRVYHYLCGKHGGDLNTPLPRLHRRFNIRDYVYPESI